MTIRREQHHHKYKNNWQGELVSLLNELHADVIDRRTFLIRVTALLAATALPLPVRSETEKEINAAKENASQHPEEPWRTLFVVQDHLFPTTPNAPGAKEINATAYLKQVLAEPQTDPDDKEFIRNGFTWLDEISLEKQGAVFINLNEQQREEVLRQIEKTRAGERWIALILLYVFEALLCDPVYGGNPGGVGWQWLEHQPGFPRPSVNQTYQKL